MAERPTLPFWVYQYQSSFNDTVDACQLIFADEFGNGNDYAEFFTALGNGSPSDVSDAPDNDDDLVFEKHQQVTCKSLCSIESLFNYFKLFQSVVTLYRVSDATGQLAVEEVGTKPLQQSMLKKEVIFDPISRFPLGPSKWLACARL